MKWRDNMVSVHEEGVAGSCPYCGSIDTDYIYWEKENERSSLNIWCNSCGERVHADCGVVPENRKHISLEMALKLQHEISA